MLWILAALRLKSLRSDFETSILRSFNGPTQRNFQMACKLRERQIG